MYFLISSDCQTIPTIGAMKRLGGLTTKGWEDNANPTTSTTDAYDYQQNSSTVFSLNITGTLDLFDDVALNQKEFFDFAANFRTQGYADRKLWIGLTDSESEELIDYMLIDSISDTSPTDGNRTKDISLSHGGELNPKHTYL